MRVDLFDFELPPERIALHPARPRDSARMLVVGPDGTLADKVVTDITDILREGDMLVVNDTRVLPAQLRGERHRDGLVAGISVNLHKRIDPSRWLAFARPAKKLKPGDAIRFGAPVDRACFLSGLDATVEQVDDGGQVTLAFEFTGPVLDDAIRELGEMPLPPYIGAKRKAEEADKADYQTIFADREGAVAAPTAGLHFTDTLLKALADKGIETTRLTLHVGAGTFLPVKADDTDDHKMHAEWGEVSPEAAERINATRAKGGRIVAVGTTSLRLLESAASADGRLRPFAGETDIFITPGYQFRAVDVLMTNFHLPKSTLFMLVSAFSGLEAMQNAYRHAVENEYRFYSYGDASLLIRPGVPA
ncbi:tRNA preQ1(34) S-adenosylmethionine ribosyltransferase-isomerase QueA [Cucumibacter marinus]|uniref:tRNA preQ1(34) S-adenosylmethionine ribosyltransferase-isomerase QueA n=1 Tax=Cucumibacter marinus TaxID=1121252 RepID=UPI00040D0ADE|nr:tRNA preQ1(34) S-adenosylmethionine ribosyltransferase-isomerase QueA [Cucumibacter marinus]